MLSKLFKNSNREGEEQKNKERSDRFKKTNGKWFFKTREGMDIGPFLSRRDAQYALLFFIERDGWPTEQQLKDFVEGCELMDGAG